MDDNITISGHDVGGCYYRPWGGEVYINNTPHDLSNGLIVVNTDATDDYIISSLAHEFRHHLQMLHGVESDCIGWKLNEGDSYKNNIIEYFSKSITELDALLYEYNVTGDCESGERIDWLIQSNANGLGACLDKYITINS
jgi:hypothetical protein